MTPLIKIKSSIICCWLLLLLSPKRRKNIPITLKLSRDIAYEDERKDRQKDKPKWVGWMINKNTNRPYFAFVNYCFVVGGGISKLKVNLTCAVFVFCSAEPSLVQYYSIQHSMGFPSLDMP